METKKRDYFDKTRVSFMEVLDLPEEKIPFKKLLSSKTENGDNDDDDYYFPPHGNSFLRVSNYWGVINDSHLGIKNCCWLIAGEEQTSGKRRVGQAYFTDFEDFQDNSWSSLKELYEILPKTFEISEAELIEWLLVDEQLDYRQRVNMIVTEKCGPNGINNKRGWILKTAGKNYDLPDRITVKESNEKFVLVDGVRVPKETNRDVFIFAIVLSRLTQKILLKDTISAYINGAWLNHSSSFSLLLGKIFEMPYNQESNCFTFKIAEETVIVKMTEGTGKERLPFVSWVEKIKFG
jgi:hypothetical protein